MLAKESVIKTISERYESLMPQETWGELSFFYNPDEALPRGTYFCTIKDKNGDNDKASGLDRENTYRLNFGLPSKKYIQLFGEKPKRPAKGCIIEGSWNFQKRNLLMPHPVYGWMGWVAILNPDEGVFDEILPMMDLAYEKAKASFNKWMNKA